ncbi:MAG: HAMP domain-containing sensor histidine kinase [Gemmatimonadota bacterium]
MNGRMGDQGVALMCDADGTILRFLRDDLELARRATMGAKFEDLVDSGGAIKARSFIETLRARGVTFEWEFNVQWKGRPILLYFAGGWIGDKLLLVGAPSRAQLSRLNDELMRINNEQANALRLAMKDVSLLSRGTPQGADAEAYDDLTRVNNELANLQREMARKNVELERLNQEKTHFVGMAAHDLRTPLGVILGYSRFLEREIGTELTDEQTTFLTTIREMSAFMLRMIDDLLDVSAIESGRLALALEECDIASLVRNNIRLNRALAGSKDISIEYEETDPPSSCLCDPDKVEQVLNNLVANAIKFSERGTTVHVRLQGDQEGVTVTVQDEGQGIPEDELPRLFKPFGTTSVRATDGEGSTGLGLAIVRRIVEGHGGTVGVESEAGVGSTFTFSLPTGGRAP